MTTNETVQEQGNLLVLCDTEEEYAQLLTEYLRRSRDIPWEIHTYTSVGELLEAEEQTRMSMLVVAESAYGEELNVLKPLRTVVLNESGILRWDGVRNVNKYQRADNVLRELLEIYMDVARVLPRLDKCFSTQFIGLYSPVGRCMQTTFALTLGQMLAQKYRTLYLNFEHFAGNAELLPDAETRDLSDLLYFLMAENDKFRLRMKTMIRHKGSMDYIPPMSAGQNLLSVRPEDWVELIRKLEELGEYEFVVMDLSESMQGLFDVLRLCGHIFTLTREDHIAQSKLEQYLQVLEACDYEDVLGKTSRFPAPKVRRIPTELEQYTKGDLADFVREKLKEIGVE